MPDADRIISPTEGAPVEVVNPNGQGRVVLVCEHAQNRMPAAFSNLGLSGEVLTSHVAWDPGAESVARLISRHLDAPLLAARFSRLIYDCNRPPDSAAAMPARSEIHDIPGNRNLTDADRAARAAALYWPFHRAVDAQIERLPHAALVTVHSFTPVYFGQHRSTEIGILHDSDSRLADRLLAGLARHSDFRAKRNRPYGPEDGVTHTLQLHALPNGLPNVMIEVRNDLIATEEAQKLVARLLADSLTEALAGPLPEPTGRAKATSGGS